MSFELPQKFTAKDSAGREKPFRQENLVRIAVSAVFDVPLESVYESIEREQSFSYIALFHDKDWRLWKVSADFEPRKCEYEITFERAFPEEVISDLGWLECTADVEVDNMLAALTGREIVGNDLQMNDEQIAVVYLETLLDRILLNTLATRNGSVPDLRSLHVPLQWTSKAAERRQTRQYREVAQILHNMASVVGAINVIWLQSLETLSDDEPETHSVDDIESLSINELVSLWVDDLESLSGDQLESLSVDEEDNPLNAEELLKQFSVLVQQLSRVRKLIQQGLSPRELDQAPLDSVNEVNLIERVQESKIGTAAMKQVKQQVTSEPRILRDEYLAALLFFAVEKLGKITPEITKEIILSAAPDTKLADPAQKVAIDEIDSQIHSVDKLELTIGYVLRTWGVSETDYVGIMGACVKEIYTKRTRKYGRIKTLAASQNWHWRKFERERRPANTAVARLVKELRGMHQKTIV